MNNITSYLKNFRKRSTRLDSENIPSRISKSIEEKITSLGFSRHSRSFYKKQGDLLFIITIIAEKWNTKVAGDFYIDYGVFVPKVIELQTKGQVSQFPTSYESILRKEPHDIKNIIPNTWKYNKYTNIEFLGEKMGESIIRTAPIFFDNYKTMKDVLNTLLNIKIWQRGDYPFLYSWRATLHILTGDKKAAQSEIDNLIKKDKTLNQQNFENLGRKRYIWKLATNLKLQVYFPELEGESCLGIYFPIKGKRLIKDERKTREKLLGILMKLEDEKKGYMWWGNEYSTAGQYREDFVTREPEYVIKYLEKYKDRLPVKISKIKINDEF